MRKPIIAGNWKMNKTQTETVELLNRIVENYTDVEVDAVVCVPFTSISKASELLDNTMIRLGAQNMFYEENGAFTGEVSPNMLKNLGVEYVILGHSERREIFGEEDDLINKKVKTAINHKITPILCVGETLDERESGEYLNKVKTQILNGFDGIGSEDVPKVVVAYEPIWAIGTGKTATSEDANNMCKYIREVIAELYEAKIADNVRIQYGGSVKPENISELMSMSDIDGALVGGASLDSESYLALLNY